MCYKLSSMILAVVCLVFSDVGIISAAPSYTVTDLGTVPGGAWSAAHAINTSGQVVGSSVMPGGYDQAFLWSNGIMTNLGTLGGAASSAYGINDYGQVVGIANTSRFSHAFLWSSGVMTDLGILPGGQSSRARAINVSGQVVGYSTASDGYQHPFLWSNGVMTDLGALGSNTHSYAMDINASGQVVGSSKSHAFLWSAGTMTDLDPISSNTSEAQAINDTGQIVGNSMAWGNGRAFLWSGGTMTNLGTLPGCIVSYAKDVNDSVQVVGWSRTSGGTELACLWSGGTVTDLGSVLPSDSGWQLQRAQGINDAGQIAGYGRLGGSTHAFLLTPIPEPSTLVLLGMAAIGLLGWAWRRRRAA